jgi:hypothetical protein
VQCGVEVGLVLNLGVFFSLGNHQNLKIFFKFEESN